MRKSRGFVPGDLVRRHLSQLNNGGLIVSHSAEVNVAAIALRDLTTDVAVDMPPAVEIVEGLNRRKYVIRVAREHRHEDRVPLEDAVVECLVEKVRDERGVRARPLQVMERELPALPIH